MENKESKVYELGYLILPSVAEDKVSTVVDKIKGIISKNSGKELEGEEPMKIDLAYTMTKTIGASRYVVNDAYLGWIKFELEPAQAVAFKSEIDQTDEILRSILIKVPRETSFSFAKAKALLAEKEAEAQEAREEEAAENAPAPEVVE
jgi:ribosomal protein S6